MERVQISSIRFTPASSADVQTGLLGWVALVYGELRLDGIAVRRARDGDLVLSFPARRDRQGRDHAYLRPRDEAARREIEAQVLAAIDLGETAP